MARNEDRYDIRSVRDRAVTEYATDADGADSVFAGLSLEATAAPGARARRTLDGKTTICVSAELSGAAATVVIYCILAYVDNEGTRTVLGVQKATATATAIRTGETDGDYIAELIYFDCAGANQYELRIEDPSAGSVDLRAWEL